MDIINMSSKQITSNITLDSYNTSGYLKIVNYFNRKMVIKKIDPIRCDEVISKVLFLNRYKNLMPSNFVIPEFLVLLDNKDLYMAIDYINGNNLGDVLKDKNINICKLGLYLVICIQINILLKIIILILLNIKSIIILICIVILWLF